jgi:retron-type reverse transcriptase
VNKENIIEAHRNARKGKTHYKEVQMVDRNLEYYVQEIYLILLNETYKTSSYITFEYNDGNKIREISKLPYYPDRIVHWAIMLQIENVFLKTFINDTYASIPNKGIHYGVKRIKKALNDKDNTQYCLKLDVKKFFPNINHKVLKELLRKKFKDKKLLKLLYEIIDSSKGIPIGNYLSQYFANFYLNYFDHYIKSLGVKYYFRYMDDIVILHKDKTYLHGLFNSKIVPYLDNNLKLKVKENWQIFPTKVRGIDFVGYRFFYNYTLLRKSTYKKLRYKMIKCKQTKHLERSKASYSGWLLWANCYNLSKKYIKGVL